MDFDIAFAEAGLQSGNEFWLVVSLEVDLHCSEVTHGVLVESRAQFPRPGSVVPYGSDTQTVTCLPTAVGVEI